jgi:hypothetical protein
MTVLAQELVTEATTEVAVVVVRKLADVAVRVIDVIGFVLSSCRRY